MWITELRANAKTADRMMGNHNDAIETMQTSEAWVGGNDGAP
jgi:hypothetical protein